MDDSTKPQAASPSWARRNALWLTLGCLAISSCLAMEGIHEAWQPVTVRAATPEDPTLDKYFPDWLGKLTKRNILVVEGTFTRSTWLTATLYLIEDGTLTELNSITVGRTSNRIGDQYWDVMTMTLALGDADREGARYTEICCAGHTRAGGSCIEQTHNVQAVESIALPGNFSFKGEMIAYVEGDRPFEVDRTMTPSEFAKANPASFLVVTLELE